MSRKVEKIMKKETKELSDLRKKANKKAYKGHMIIIISLLCIVRCLDEFASSVGGSIQSWIVREFFVSVGGMTYEEGLSRWSLISTAMMVFTIMAVFYLALSDRFGRKPILVTTALGMGLGMLLCNTSTNLGTYLGGTALITFFVANDVHQIYVMELAPAEKRATYIQLTAVFGSVGTLLVSVSRSVYTTDEVLAWRMIYLIPAIIGIVAGILLIFFSRETDVYLKQRIEYLEKPYEQRQAESKAGKKSGIRPAFKYIFTHKQVRSNMIATIPQLFSIMAFNGYYESIMTQSGMTTTQVNQALLIYPISIAVVSILVGILSDKFGRRPIALITSVVAFAGLVSFVLCAKNDVNPYVIGLIYGLEMGAFWRYGDTLGLERSESVPTIIRASVASAFGLIATLIATIAGVILSILVKYVEVGTLCLTWGAITLGLSAVLNFIMVKETMGVNLEGIE